MNAHNLSNNNDSLYKIYLYITVEELWYLYVSVYMICHTLIVILLLYMYCIVVLKGRLAYALFNKVLLFFFSWICFPHNVTNSHRTITKMVHFKHST